VAGRHSVFPIPDTGTWDTCRDRNPSSTIPIEKFTISKEVTMAICRCSKDHHSPPKSGKYVACVEPIGYPKSAAICGRDAEKLGHCRWPGLVWLYQQEVRQYNNGKRIFHMHSRHEIQVKVKNGGTTSKTKFGKMQSPLNGRPNHPIHLKW
jgi:hypothetical protein